MTDELPPDLADLFAAERDARPSAALRTIVRSRLVASAALGSVATSSTSAAAAGGAAAATGLVTKVIVGLAIAVGGTTAAVVATRAPSHEVARAPAPVLAPVPARVAVPAPPPPIAAATEPVVEPEVVAPAPVHVPKRRIEPEPEPEPEPVRVSDAALLAQAWRILPDDPAAALALVAKTHGDALAEEREAIRCVALARLHDPDAASAIAQFLSAHPRSLHRALVERAQKGLP